MPLRLLVLVLAFAPVLRAASALDEAESLFEAKRYPEARAALEKILVAEPANAAACHLLGSTLLRRGDTNALDDAVKWLEKATTLAPGNATYLADYGGTLLQLARKNTSFSAAMKGRAAMERAVTLDPDDLDAREGLFQFYQQAPWPLGSEAKAATQLEAIRRRNPDRATVLGVIARANAKDFAAAFDLCNEVLAKNPADYTALYQYGRTAAISGQNLERGLASLRKCLELAPPGPASPTHSNVWNRIGSLQEKLHRPAEARAAYESALQLDPNNQPAAAARARLQ